MKSVVNLNILEEPRDIKILIKATRTIMFSKYLWEKWNPLLKAKGYTSQNFLRVLRFHICDIIMWTLADKIEWRDLIKRITTSLERYRGG